MIVYEVTYLIENRTSARKIYIANSEIELRDFLDRYWANSVITRTNLTIKEKTSVTEPELVFDIADEPIFI